MELDENWLARFAAAGGTQDNPAANTDVPDTKRRKVAASPAPTGDMFDEATSRPRDAAPPPKRLTKPNAPSAGPRKRGRPQGDFEQRSRAKSTSTAQQEDLFELALEIDEADARATGNLGFIATAMIHASLPHSKVKDAQGEEAAVYKRKSGDLSLTIVNDPAIGLPYGKVPRIIVAFLSTEAKRRQKEDNPTLIYLGRSQAEFARKLGQGTGGGERGGITALKNQAARLLTSKITLTASQASTNKLAFRNVSIADGGMLLWNPQEPDERAEWESHLTLTDRFFKECVHHSVPIDMRVINALSSPLAIDIYVWLTYRYNVLSRDLTIGWEQLRWQFGSNYALDDQGQRNFKTNFLTQLRAVHRLYPQARFSPQPHGLLLQPSSPHVLPQPSADRD